MNCFDIQEKIIDLVIGELTQEDALLIREHIEECPMCREEFQLINECVRTCTLEETETCECYFQETYWENFVVDMHERISHEKMERKFPFHIVVPIAASAVLTFVLGYFIFFRPQPQETVEEEPSYYEYDPYDEIHELSPEETEEFIELINQQYKK